MSIAQFLSTFWNDGKVEILVLLVAADFLLGVISALKRRVFRLAYVADFVRKDVVFKIGGYLVLYAGSVYAGQADILVDGLDLGVAAGAAYAVILAAMVGSVANSIKEIFTDTPSPPPLSPVAMLTADENV